jgi:hypothetical protein
MIKHESDGTFLKERLRSEVGDGEARRKHGCPLLGGDTGFIENLRGNSHVVFYL